MDWFLYDRELRYEIVTPVLSVYMLVKICCAMSAIVLWKLTNAEVAHADVQ